MAQETTPPINFSDLDLNLLKVFDVLMQERNLTRAADRLGKSVAATSHALRRLREDLHDELFETPGRGMVPTRRALEIAPCIRECLGSLRVGLSAEPLFDPKTARRLFTIDIPIGADLMITPALMAYAEEHAPGVTLQVLSDRAQVLRSELRYGETEAAIDHEQLTDEGLRSELLYDDPFVLMSRVNHPGVRRGERITAETYSRLKHVGLSWTRTKGDGPMNDRLLRRGIERDIRIRVPTLGSLPAVIESTDLVCALSARVARHFAKRWKIDLHELDLTIDPVQIWLVWHERFDKDPGHAWLRSAIKQACQSI